MLLLSWVGMSSNFNDSSLSLIENRTLVSQFTGKRSVDKAMQCASVLMLACTIHMTTISQMVLYLQQPFQTIDDDCTYYFAMISQHIYKWRLILMLDYTLLELFWYLHQWFSYHQHMLASKRPSLTRQQISSLVKHPAREFQRLC